jgi:HEAT repeat protein
MFGNKGGQMKHMVDKHEWDKMLKKFDSFSTEERVQLAEACGASNDENAVNMLITLVKDKDVNVQLAACKSLAVTGTQGAKTTLMWLLGNLPADKAALKQPILDAVDAIGDRK